MSKTDKTLNKCDELIERLTELKKALQAPSARKPVPALGAGWSQDPGTGAFHHSGHGLISTTKHPDGYYQISHGGRPVGRASNPGEAGAKIKKYISTLSPHDTGMHNPPAGILKGEGDVEKSGYGPKGGSQYNPADNVKRKMNNTSDQVMNRNVKSYTGRATAHKEPKGPAGPVKQYTPEQIAAINEARKLKKNAEDAPWVQHSNVPNADAELTKLQDVNPAIPGEDALANQLAGMMHSKSMMRPDHRQPTSEDMIMAGERMGLGANPELIKAADQQWGGAINNWLAEASKPISARFSSPEEEAAYWDSIKVADRDDGKPGY